MNAVGTVGLTDMGWYDPQNLPNFLSNSTGVAVGTKSDKASYADGTSGRPVVL